MTSEIELFHLNGVLITNRRFTAHRHSFAMHTISSVRLVSHPLWWTAPAAATMLGLVAGIVVIRAISLFSITAAVLSLLLAALLWTRGMQRYSLEIETDDGHFAPLQSKDGFFMQGIAGTLGSAVERYGRAAIRSASETISEPSAMQLDTASFSEPHGKLLPVLCAPSGERRPEAPRPRSHASPKRPAADLKAIPPRKNSIA